MAINITNRKPVGPVVEQDLVTRAQHKLAGQCECCGANSATEFKGDRWHIHYHSSNTKRTIYLLNADVCEDCEDDAFSQRLKDESDDDLIVRREKEGFIVEGATY